MIYEKLQKARVQLQETNLKKSGKNNYAGFEYFELKDFLPTVNKIFLDLKMSSNFSMNEAFATLQIIDCEKEESTIDFTSPIAELDLKGCNKIQALGGTHTYIKRYLYLNALEIVENDLFDSTTGKNNDKNKKAPQKEESPAVKLHQKLKKANLNAEQIQQFCTMNNLSSKNPKGIEDFMADEQVCNEIIINYLKGVA